MATNGATSNQNPRIAASKPAPTGPAPPVPASAPPNPPNLTSTGNSRSPHSQTHHFFNCATVNGATSHAHPPATNTTGSQKGKKKAESVDPAAMYETVRSRIAALEEEEVHGEEEERRIGAWQSINRAKYLASSALSMLMSACSGGGP